MMIQTFALLFPGQGSQSVGMLKALADTFPVVKTVFSKASECFGEDLWELSQQGPAERLDQTSFTQPALLAAGIAVWECWREMGGPMPQYVAGHSLGEYAALVCANVLSFEETMRLVVKRGLFMQAAVPEGVGAMAAIIGLDDADVQSACDSASDIGLVSPANFNSIGQVVIAGETAAVEKAMDLAKSAGARLVKRIAVSVPSHCALMKPAALQMKTELSTATFHAPQIPVIHNVNANVINSPEAIREALIQQLVSPVRWVTSIQKMMQCGVQYFFECGPGSILSGLNKRISKECITHALDSKESIIYGIQLITGGS